MDLLEAKNIFKIQDKFGQSELDTFYSFEKNLLLQKLSDQATEEELNEAQESLSQLERAYSILGCELTSPSIVQENFQEEGPKKAVNPLFIGIAIGIAGAAGAYFFLAPQHASSPAPAVSTTTTNTATPSTNTTVEPKIEILSFKSKIIQTLELDKHKIALIRKNMVCSGMKCAYNVNEQEI